ncbi:hypothetical protein pdam_00025546 [Pocillopora damicornis]|uniref:HTH CENPB-type domain-containing protein n=1 Tax=Pocillopora damicornis TaxID=46731 RepID=A0A3M6TGR4_POCDA|nr:hypothetical protein pdam_00025546 [Pocillopora damicornis]
MTARRASMGRCRPKDPEVNQQLVDSFSNQRSKGLAVNSSMIRLKAKEISSDPDFKASPGWYTKWKRRHAISMRSKTTLAPPTWKTR